MTPQMMVLGLIAAESGTIADTQRRLADMFPWAEFSKNAAHGNLPALALKGHARLVEKGAEQSGDLYEIAKTGIEHLRRWVVSVPPPPAIREPIHGKVEFATFEDLAALVRIVRTVEVACRAAHDAAHERLLEQQRLRMTLGSKDWRADLDRVLSEVHLEDASRNWSDLAKSRQLLGDRLEEVLARFAPRAG
jgi:hypothetical protein